MTLCFGVGGFYAQKFGFQKKNTVMGLWDVIKTPTARDFSTRNRQVLGVGNYMEFPIMDLLKLSGAKIKKTQPMWRLPKKSLFHSKQLPGCYPKSTNPKSVRFTDGCLINQGSSEVMFFFGWKSMRIANVFVSNFGSRIHIRVSLPRVSSHS